MQKVYKNFGNRMNLIILSQILLSVEIKSNIISMSNPSIFNNQLLLYNGNKPKMAYSRDALLDRDKREIREIWSYGGWPIIV